MAKYLFPDELENKKQLKDIDEDILVSQAQKEKRGNGSLIQSNSREEEKNSSDLISASRKNEGWEIFKKITSDNFGDFRVQWKIGVERTRKNVNDKTFYMNCKLEKCPVKYKARITFHKEEKKQQFNQGQDQKDDEIIIFMKFNHNHTIEELEAIHQYGIKQEVKSLIEPLIANRVKPTKIKKNLEDYKDQGRMKEQEMPSINQISDLKRNFNKKNSFIGTESEFLQLIKRFNNENRE